MKMDSCFIIKIVTFLHYGLMFSSMDCGSRDLGWVLAGISRDHVQGLLSLPLERKEVLGCKRGEIPSRRRLWGGGEKWDLGTEMESLPCVVFMGKTILSAINRRAKTRFVAYNTNLISVRKSYACVTRIRLFLFSSESMWRSTIWFAILLGEKFSWR